MSSVITNAYYDVITEEWEEEQYGSVALWSGNRTFLTGDPAVTLRADTDMLSRDYSAEDEYGNFIYTVPVLELTRDIGGLDKTFRASLAVNMEPHYRYDVIITINSVLVNIVVTALPWDAESDSQEVGTYPVWTFDATADSGWTGHSDTGSILDN